MMQEKEILRRFIGLERRTLRVWIERGWVSPERVRGGYRFREIDAARVGLIFEFSTELELDEETIDVVLPLLDQVHGLRHQLRRLADAIKAQPDDVQRRIGRALAGMKD